MVGADRGRTGARDQGGRRMMERVEKETGAKTRQRRDNEDRAKAYRLWRHGRGGRSACVCDIDQLEYRYVDGIPVPVGILEITRYDGNVADPPAEYLDRIIERYEERDGQARACRRWAEMLGVEAWIVLFRHSIAEVGPGFFDHDFWIYQLTDPNAGWFAISQPQYDNFLRKLAERALRGRRPDVAADPEEPAKLGTKAEEKGDEEDVPI